VVLIPAAAKSRLQNPVHYSPFTVLDQSILLVTLVSPSELVVATLFMVEVCLWLFGRPGFAELKPVGTLPALLDLARVSVF